MDKPQLAPRDERGRFGATYVRNVVETGWRCILQDFQGTNDRGFDGIVIEVHRGRTTSVQFNIQIKTSTFDRDYPGNEFRAPVDAKHLVLWRDSNVPVVLVCVDIGPSAKAYWRLISPIMKDDKILVNRRNMFDPTSRDEVMVAVKNAFLKQVSAAKGEVLDIPLIGSIRDVAKEYYRRELMTKTYTDNPVFGPVSFTWKGWRHMTKKDRASKYIARSLTLLPCVRSVIGPGNFPSSWRPFPTITRGSLLQYRTLLWFNRVCTFDDRAPAWIQVLIERRVFLPIDWSTCPPDDPRRLTKYTFLGIQELAMKAPTGNFT
jgi:hypothetical protein